MKLIKILTIVLFFSSNVLADTINYLLKIPNLEIINVENNNRIKTFKAKKYFKVGIKDNNVECYSPSNQLVKEKQKLIKESLDLYTNEFLTKINLRFIVLCKDLEVASIPALGVPNHPLKTIIVNINTGDYKLSRTIHHEIFHIINDQYRELFDYEKWKKFNSENFKYQSCSTCTDKFGMKLLREKKGFLSEYSQSTVGEDMAETFSFLMIKNSGLKKKLQNDDILKKKVNFIKLNIQLIDKNFKFKL
tara:strand:- start:59 stop:802 length:744 start_codon:yes stop_codon:yes gene_type:complete